MSSQDGRLQTQLNRSGRDASQQHGFINCPIYRGSTVLYDSLEEIEKGKRYFYGTAGNPTVSNLEDAWSSLTGAAGTVILSSGLGAVSLSILTVVKAGDNLLMVDSAYLPTRNFCDDFLRKMGVTTTYYDPMITANELLVLLDKYPTTSLLFMESPGSQTFEVQDVPSLTAAARTRGVATIIDNTWATPLFYDALKKGCDMSVEAGTKYLSGHSDILLGLVAANEKWYPKLRDTYICFSMVPGNEDCFLALRGLRTMYIRVKEAEKRALIMASWLKQRDEVLTVLHPAFPNCPGHDIWKRDYTGSTGLFSIVLKPQFQKEHLSAMLNKMKLFGLGFSWGGFESLMMVYDCSTYRTATRYAPGGILLRIQVGLEDLDDLKDDIDQGFRRMRERASVTSHL